MTVDETMSCITTAFEAGRLAQAYIIMAPPRAEGAEVADRVLAMLFCEQPGAACGTCRGCRQAAAHTHPDLHWIEPQKRSRIISIEQIRSLRTEIYQTAYAGGWKACVIVGADRLGDAAANAFLKTLEEPTEKTLFLLLTDAPQFLLPTIRSRCQVIGVTSAPTRLPDALYEALTAIQLQRPGSGGVLSSFARTDRICRILKELKAAALAAEREIADDETVEETGDTLDARANARYRELRSGVMSTLLDWYRDLMILAGGGSEAVVTNQAHLAVLKERAAGLSYAETLENVRAIEDIDRQLERNMPENQVLAAGMCRLRG